MRTKELPETIKQDIAAFFLRTSIPRILAEQEGKPIQIEADTDGLPSCRSHSRIQEVTIRPEH